MQAVANLDQLLRKIPEPLQPAAAKYGPVLMAMTHKELWAWIDLLAAGDVEKAYSLILAGLADDDLLDQWDRVNSEWSGANAANARQVNLQRQAAAAVLEASLATALALVGL